MSESFYAQNFPPVRPVSPQTRRTTLDITDTDRHPPPPPPSQYLSDLVAERQKLEPFMPVLPVCSRLLNQEIMRVSDMVSNQGFGDYDSLRHRSPRHMTSPNLMPNVVGPCLNVWSGHRHERLGGPQGMSMHWQGVPASPGSHVVKKVLRLEIPVDSYPNVNIVAQLLGPGGNSIRRVQASTGCRVYIRGKGSIRDPGKEEMLRGKTGFEHLNHPLHILVEAELPINIVDIRLRQAQEIIEELLKPVDESKDVYMREQLREIGLSKSNLR